MNTAVSSRWRSSPVPSLDAVSWSDREQPAPAAAASTNPAKRTHENERLPSFHRTVFIRCSSQNAASTPDPWLTRCATLLRGRAEQRTFSRPRRNNLAAAPRARHQHPLLLLQPG